MIVNSKTYCLDANVLIQAWQKYYSPKFCPDYWTVLNEIGIQGRIFLPEEVFQEIFRRSAVKRTKLEGLKRNIGFVKP